MAREVICGIYKITNNVNGKVYIGQAHDIYRRWSQHKKIGRNRNAYKREGKNPLYRSMRKYGVDEFSFEIIEKCNSAELNDKEMYWVSFYDSTIVSGKRYNQTPGGDASNFRQSVKVYQYDLDGNYINSFNSVSEATASLGLSKDNGLIQNSLDKEMSEAGGYQWSRVYVEKMHKYEIHYPHHKIASYNSDGGFAKNF